MESSDRLETCIDESVAISSMMKGKGSSTHDGRKRREFAILLDLIHQVQNLPHCYKRTLHPNLSREIARVRRMKKCGNSKDKCGARRSFSFKSIHSHIFPALP